MKEGQYTAPLARRLRKLSKQEGFLDDNGKPDSGALAMATGLHRNTVKFLLNEEAGKAEAKAEAGASEPTDDKDGKVPRGRRGVQAE